MVEKGGKVFLFALVPIFLFIYVFTPLRPVQFISLFFIFLVMGSKAYSEYLARRLRLVRRDPELRAFRYEWTGVELWVINSGRLPAFLAALGDSSGGVAVFRGIKDICTLGGESRRLFRWEAYGASRGVFTLGPATLRASDPLGLFPFTLTTAETSRFFVYPASVFASIKAPGGIPLGNLSTADLFCVDLTRPRSLRDYRPGDESRRINWKASAKSSGLMVNEYELSLSFPLVIFLNVDFRDYPVKYRTPYVERVIEAAAALCLMAARERQTLGLILHSAVTLEPSSAEQSSAVINPAAFTLTPILDSLAALEPFTADSDSSQTSAECLLEAGKTLPFGTRLVYIGPALEEKNYEALRGLTRRRLTLEYLVIDEKDLGFLRGSRRYQIKESGHDLL